MMSSCDGTRDRSADRRRVLLRAVTAEQRGTYTVGCTAESPRGGNDGRTAGEVAIRPPADLPAVAAEAPAPGRPGFERDETGGAARGSTGGHESEQGVLSIELITSLETTADRLARLGIDELADGEVERLLSRLRRPLRQLEGVRARAAAVSQSRAVAQAGSSPPDATVREHRRRLATEQQLTPSEVQQQIEAGRAVQDNEATARAVADGEVGARHAQRIAEVLSRLPQARRAAVERELLELAARLDALAFGRAARRLLARERPESLAKKETREHLDRSFRGTDTEDGGFAFSGLLYGAAAEQARVALNAFRRPDTPDELRTPQQRAADAFEQLCAAALRGGEAATNHGVRPHVMVVFTAEQYAALSRAPALTSGLFAGSGTAASGSELRNLVADAEVFRIVIDAQRTPMEVSTEVRTVPVGLWRALLLRDGGCVWHGCDAPASWCDVAHGNRSFTAGGKLSIDNAMLLCRRHHRRFDRGPYRVDIQNDRVTISRITGGDGRNPTSPEPLVSNPVSAAPPPPAGAPPPGSSPPPAAPAPPAASDAARNGVSGRSPIPPVDPSADRPRRAVSRQDSLPLPRDPAPDPPGAQRGGDPRADPP